MYYIFVHSLLYICHVFLLLLCLIIFSMPFMHRYRFANEPVVDKDDDVKETIPRKSYGGKLCIQFRSDGYTDILDANSDITTKSSSDNTATFQKVWGWDIETSNDDNLDYLLFSADVKLPPPISVEERFYFQARVDREGTNNNDGIISLNDGSVTVKRNVQAPGGGGLGWGIFRGAASILAQFRQTGEFRCKPIENPK